MDKESLEFFNKQLVDLLDNYEDPKDLKLLNKDAFSIAQLFNIVPNELELNTYNTTKKIITEITQQFINLTSGNDLEFKDCINLSNQTLFVEYYSFGNLRCGLPLKLYSFLIETLRLDNSIKFSSDIKRWEKALDHIFALFELDVSQCCSPDWKLKKLAKSVKYFENLGFQLDILYGKLDTEGESSKISLLGIEPFIENKVKQYGNLFFSFILNKLSSFSTLFDRV